MSQVEPIHIAAPSLGAEEFEAVRQVLESGWLTQGPQVAAFEEAFAARHQVAHAIATTSCTTALHLALVTMGIGPGDEVIVPSFTWVATANVVVHCGATPVLVDVDPGTYNIDATRVAEALTERTRAIIAVHLFGLPADLDAVAAVAPGIPIVEDAACATGASVRGRPVGGLGAMACFSFHPRKSVTTGEGGMLTTDNPTLAVRAESLRNHGASISEETRHVSDSPFALPAFHDIGFNYRLSDIQAAVGRVQLSRLDGFIAERDQWARWYSEKLGRVDWLQTPSIPDGYGHGWQSYVTRVRADAPYERDDLMKRLHTEGIAGRPGTHSVASLDAYRKRGASPSDYPVATALEADTLALPLHNRMVPGDFERVVKTLESF